MGNGSGADANAFSLLTLDILPSASDGFTSGYVALTGSEQDN
jgi:hypothetical protein